MDRLRKEGSALVYRCAKQDSEPVGGKVADITLTPLELMDRIATHAPPPLLRCAGTELATAGGGNGHGPDSTAAPDAYANYVCRQPQRPALSHPAVQRLR